MIVRDLKTNSWTTRKFVPPELQLNSYVKASKHLLSPVMKARGEVRAKKPRTCLSCARLLTMVSILILLASFHGSIPFFFSKFGNALIVLN